MSEITIKFDTQEDKEEFIGYMSDGGGECGFEPQDGGGFYTFDYEDWDEKKSTIIVTKHEEEE